MIDDLRSFKISNPDVQCLRILVHGPVGAGKSSFVNSIDSIFQGRMAQGALVDALGGKSFTKTVNVLYFLIKLCACHCKFAVSHLLSNLIIYNFGKSFYTCLSIMFAYSDTHSKLCEPGYAKIIEYVTLL